MGAAQSERRVYLDYAATAPLAAEVRTAIDEVLDRPDAGLYDGAANANALYSAGRAAFQRLEASRSQIARCLGARRPSEILFTSSATEADNTALLGIALAERLRRPPAAFRNAVVLSALEHDAVRKMADHLRKRDFEVRELRPDGDGFIEVRELERVIDDDVVLVSVQLANSEVGSIQPIAELAKIAHASGALFHTDAVQALGKLPIDLDRLGVDAATFSSHKLGGPPGIGALYLRHGTPFSPLIVGGGQESGRRSGTQNVIGAIGFAAAVSVAMMGQEDEANRLRTLRDRLYERLPQLPAVQATVDVEPGSRDYLPSIASFLVSGFESETLVLRYDALGFSVSGGSACSSASLEPSYALRAMGVPADAARGALRVSMGRGTTERDIDDFIAATRQVLEWQPR